MRRSSSALPSTAAASPSSAIDAYNVTNSVRWGNPTTGYSTAAGNTFGQITGTTGGQRSVRFGGRFVF